MPTLRVTLSTGETHEVDVTPETVVSFTTTTYDGRGRQVAQNNPAWADVAAVETVDDFVPFPETTPQRRERQRAKNARAEAS